MLGIPVLSEPECLLDFIEWSVVRGLSLYSRFLRSACLCDIYVIYDYLLIKCDINTSARPSTLGYCYHAS